MNAALRAVVRQSIYRRDTIWGIQRGFQGLLDGARGRLRLSSVADIIKSGGTYLRTARCPAFLQTEGQERAAATLRQWAIDGLVVIGGEGSLTGAAALSRQGIAVVGVPASIDNDIFGTDLSIGFDTAVNNVTRSMDQIRDTASAHDRVFVIEVMGRRSGAIALAAGLAGGAETILVPEIPVRYDQMLTRLRQSHARGKRHSLVLVAEGAVSGQEVMEVIRRETGYEVRLTILGHTQRGGPPTAQDRILGSILGVRAVEWLANGQHGVMAGLSRGEVIPVPLTEVAGRVKTPDLELARIASVLAI